MAHPDLLPLVFIILILLIVYLATPEDKPEEEQ